MIQRRNDFVLKFSLHRQCVMHERSRHRLLFLPKVTRVRCMLLCRCLIRRSFGAARRSLLLGHKPRVKFSVEFLSFSCFYVVSIKYYT